MNAGHETRDADVGSLFLIAIILLLSGVVVCLSAWVAMRFFAEKEASREIRSPVSHVVANLAEPRLETKLETNLQEVRRGEEAELNSYGWINRNAGLAHIPIDRAMEIIAAHGLPEVGPNITPLQLMQARPQQTESQKAGATGPSRFTDK